MYLLDTNVCIEILRGNEEFAGQLARRDPSTLKLCAVVKAELSYGASLSAHKAANLRTVEAFCAPFVSLPFDDACAQTYGVLRADLRHRGMQAGSNDLMIAATALTHDLTLVTHDTKEFERIPGLRLEDWRPFFLDHAALRAQLPAMSESPEDLARRLRGDERS